MENDSREQEELVTLNCAEVTFDDVFNTTNDALHDYVFTMLMRHDDDDSVDAQAFVDAYANAHLVLFNEFYFVSNEKRSDDSINSINLINSDIFKRSSIH